MTGEENHSTSKEMNPTIEENNSSCEEMNTTSEENYSGLKENNSVTDAMAVATAAMTVGRVQRTWNIIENRLRI